MAEGTIHAIDDMLFLIEGRWPARPEESVPGPAVLHSGDRLYLLDTGAGPRIRGALHAVTASFASSAAEVTLVNSGRHPGLTGNNDLLETFVADRRRALLAESGFRACLEPLPLGDALWPGMVIDDGDVIALEATVASERLAFYLPVHRALLLPDEICLTPEWPGSDPTDVLRSGERALALLDAGLVDVVSLGFGPVLGTGEAEQVITDMVQAAAPLVGRRRTGRPR